MVLQAERAYQKQPTIFQNAKIVEGKNKGKKGLKRYIRRVGLGFKPPREVRGLCVCITQVLPIIILRSNYLCMLFQNERAFQKQAGARFGSKLAKNDKLKGKRYVRKVGLGFKVPKEVCMINC